ncbi:MAG: hypothetical protein JO168_02665 [Solirubrobacterales bacterium]|nr:hypothetical protein [Solirubrobacterales bacterium]MBV9714739.1 hypothetical protein [Solirubrobacterales bacterium]
MTPDREFRERREPSAPSDVAASGYPPDPAAESTASTGESAAPAGQSAAASGELAEPARTGRRGRRDRGDERNMLPGRERRRFGLERLLVRLVATAGIVGIGVALGAILVSSTVQGWIIGLVVAGVSVILSAILWSSRQL